MASHDQPDLRKLAAFLSGLQADEVQVFAQPHTPSKEDIKAWLRWIEQQVSGEQTGAWNDAYAAYTAAFDTPLARRRHDDEYAADARVRMCSFDELFRANQLDHSQQS